MALNSDEKGQAAITDSLYFLMIVSALCIVLFLISNAYGNTVVEQIKRQYGSEYAASAFKTIFKSSTPRIEGQALEETPEVDYLLARVKEDFADDQKLNSTAGLLANNIVGIMEPVQDNYDYVFYIYNSGGSTTDCISPTDPGCSGTITPGGNAGLIFLLFSLHRTTSNDLDKANCTANPTMVWVGNACLDTEQVIFLCYPASGLANVHKVEGLLSNVGSVSKSESWIRLISQNSSGNDNLEAAQVNLAMWVSTVVPEDVLNELQCSSSWKRSGREWEKIPTS
ncbi:MAG: hypothetical protein PHD95_05650 [Candidatus ainarchaeum sp.]|nr:hypothetical protein [Candidatus ainarchaeum sp.]